MSLFLNDDDELLFLLRKNLMNFICELQPDKYKLIVWYNLSRWIFKADMENKYGRYAFVIFATTEEMHELLERIKYVD